MTWFFILIPLLAFLVIALVSARGPEPCHTAMRVSGR